MLGVWPERKTSGSQNPDRWLRGWTVTEKTRKMYKIGLGASCNLAASRPVQRKTGTGVGMGHGQRSEQEG